MKSCTKQLMSTMMAAAIAVSVVYSQDMSKENALEILRSESLGRGLSQVTDTLKKSADESRRRVEFYIQNPANADDTLDKSNLYDVLDDGTPVYMTTDNVRAAQTTQTDAVHSYGSLGVNLSGENELIGIWDGGIVRQSHEIFTARAGIGDAGNVGDHATHVGGTLVGNIHANNGLSKGMAPNASLISYDWNYDLVEAATAVEEKNLLISNHSYGLKLFEMSVSSWGKYEVYAADNDKLHYASPYYLQVWSASNNRAKVNRVYPSRGGYDILAGYALGKNNLVVGAVSNVSLHGDPAEIKMTEFSSWGPADDGRIKPDICGMGYNVTSSTSGSNASYGTKSGTSMSSPNVAGSLLLLQEYSRREFHSYLKASTVKGLALHTADEAGVNPGPDYSFGWGLLNMKRAVTVLKQTGDSTVVDERTLDNNEVYSFKVMKNSALVPLKVSICWTDPAGAANAGGEDDATPALVNDLDLRVTDETTEYFPWRLNPAAPAAAAVKADNNVDNIEIVEVDNGIDGQVYTVNVSHKNGLQSLKQDYTVIVTGGQRVDGSCNLPQWDAATTYVQGDIVEYESASFKAKQWTRGVAPQKNSSWGQWELIRECNSAADLPSVTMISSVTNGSIRGLQQPIHFQADVSSEAGLKHVSLKVTSKDGIQNIVPEKGALYTVSYTPKTYGEHTFELIAIDNLGRKGREKLDITVFEETSVPSIFFTSHNVVDTVYAGVSNMIRINAAATICRDRDVYLSSPDYPFVEKVKLSAADAPFFTYNLDIPAYETAADMKLLAEIVEKDGTVSASQLINLKIGTTLKPEVQMISFTDSLFTSLDTVLIRASATDADGTVEKMFARLSDGTEQEMTKVGNEYQLAFAPKKMLDLVYVRIFAMDNTDALSYEKKIRVRTSKSAANSAPVVTINSVFDKVILAAELSPVSFIYTTQTNKNVDGFEYIVRTELFVNGIKQKDEVHNSLYGTRLMTTILPTKFGKNTVTVRTLDERGLWGEATTELTVALKPEITVVSPAAGSTVNLNAGDSLDVIIELTGDASITSVKYIILEMLTGGPSYRFIEGDPANNYRLRYLPRVGNTYTRLRVEVTSNGTVEFIDHQFVTDVK